MKRGRGGFTLVETVVSGAVLVIAAVMMAQVLTVSGGLLMKSRNMRRQQENLEWDIIKGEQPSGSKAVNVEVVGCGSWEVTVDIYERDLREDRSAIYFRTVGDGIHEE